MLVPRPVHLMKREQKVHCTKRYRKTLIFRTSSYSVPGYGKKKKKKKKKKRFARFIVGSQCFSFRERLVTLFQTQCFRQLAG